MITPGPVAQAPLRKALQREEREPESTLRQRQLARRAALLCDAWDHNAFYRARFEAAGLRRRDLAADDALAALPPLDKSEIQAAGLRMLRHGERPEALIRNKTGGSTGEPLRVFYEAPRQQARRAAWRHFDSWAGLRLGVRSVALWGAPRDIPAVRATGALRRRLGLESTYFDAGDLSEARFAALLELLHRVRPEVLVTYAASGGLFARWLLECNQRPPPLKSVLTSAELLTAPARRDLERAFEAPVFDRYGTRELGVIAMECEAHDGRHVNEAQLELEIVDGEVLVTDLLTRAMPMIRYRVGDRGRWAEGSCACGRSLRRIHLDEGRRGDFLLADDDRLVSAPVLATHVITEIDGIAQVAFEQPTRGALTILVARGRNYSAAAGRALTERVRAELGNGLDIELRALDTLPRTATGKLRLCHSPAAEAQIARVTSAR